MLLLGVREGIAVLEVDLLTSEATLDTVHPAGGIGINVATSGYTLDLGVEIHVQVDTCPLVGITIVSPKDTTWTLDVDLATAPVRDHLVPESLVGVVGN